eukprot:gb/GEZN01018297.1/.p2 GENE.gb/GEZN01018297.1/~~gb/GEZN01018297.1/.p2  ORF type:complete len:142 (+),score=9.61 gb/GEZN01018297.1/:200-625(+)
MMTSSKASTSFHGGRPKKIHFSHAFPAKIISALGGIGLLNFSQQFRGQHPLHMDITRKVGIRVNCICPGTIDTPLVDGAINALMKQNPDTTEAHWRKVLDEAQPIHRLGRPEEIAQAVIMCATNGFMTGALVSVDGGYVAQ